MCSHGFRPHHGQATELQKPVQESDNKETVGWRHEQRTWMALAGNRWCHKRRRLLIFCDAQTDHEHTKRQNGHARTNFCGLSSVEKGPTSRTNHRWRQPHQSPRRGDHTNSRCGNQQNFMEQRRVHKKCSTLHCRHIEFLSGNSAGSV